MFDFLEDKTARTIFIVGAVILLIVCIMTIHTGKKSDKSYTYDKNTHTITRECKSCGRLFTDDANKKSIRQTNMCKNCYKNYETAKAAGY